MSLTSGSHHVSHRPPSTPRASVSLLPMWPRALGSLFSKAVMTLKLEPHSGRWETEAAPRAPALPSWGADQSWLL